MSRESFLIKISTPAGVAAEEPVICASLPGPGGEIEVLPQHREYAAVLEAGLLSYTAADTSQVSRMFISGGLCTFNQSVLTVLADQVETPDSIDRAAYAAERPELIKLLGEGHCDDEVRVAARRKLHRIECLEKLLA